MKCCPPKCSSCGPCSPCGSCCDPCGKCGPCGSCEPCGPCGSCGPRGPCGACCGQPPCAVISYQLTSGPVGPLLPEMKYCGGCCPATCAPPFYFVPNKCGCCWEWGCYGPYY